MQYKSSSAAETQHGRARTPIRRFLGDVAKHETLSHVGWAGYAEVASKMDCNLLSLGPHSQWFADVAVCLYIWLKPSNRTHSLEERNFWMWTKSHLALPPSPQPQRWETYNSLCSEDLRAPSRSACRGLDSTQAVQPKTRSFPFCFSWTTGGFICFLFTYSSYRY